MLKSARVANSTSTSFTKFGPIMTESHNKKQATFRKKTHRQFFFIPTNLFRSKFSLSWKVSEPKFHAKTKAIKWATKLAKKRKTKGKKESEKKDQNRFTKKGYGHARVTKKVLNYIH